MAYEGIKKFRCGGCGCEDYKLYGDNHHDPTMILAECQECKSMTEITISKPTIKLDFGENSEGVMAIF